MLFILCIFFQMLVLVICYILSCVIILILIFAEVVRMMQFVAQASHEIIPPDVLEPVLRALVNNFVTERNSSDVMAIG